MKFRIMSRIPACFKTSFGIKSGPTALAFFNLLQTISSSRSEESPLHSGLSMSSVLISDSSLDLSELIYKRKSFSGLDAHSINGLYRLEKSDFYVSITMSNSSDTDPSSRITLMGISLFFWGPKRFIWFQNCTGSLVFISSISSANFLLYALSAFLKCLSKSPALFYIPRAI